MATYGEKNMADKVQLTRPPNEKMERISIILSVRVSIYNL